MSVAESEDEREIEDDSFSYNVRWVIPQKLNQITFIGRDVLAVASDIYIVFLNLKNNTELVYVANNEESGDGVDVIAGHKGSVFTFAEKGINPRIFVLSYPWFGALATFKDADVNRYKGLCMMENDMIAAFSGFPNYIMTVWNWRTGQRLLSVPTEVVRRDQCFISSRTHMLVCECWGEGLIVWEIAQCFKQCFIMRRAKEEVTGWEVSEPPFVGVCWSIEGQLYAIDPKANLYSCLSDGIGMVANLEWSEEITGDRKPLVCSFYNGFLVYGPDHQIRSLKKFDHKWKVVWSYVPNDTVARLVSNAICDMAAVWCESGLVYKLTGECEEKIDIKPVTFKQRGIKKIQLIAPDYTHLVTIDDFGVLCIYDVNTADLIHLKYVQGNDVSFEASPVESMLIVFGEVGPNYGMALYTFNPEEGLQKVNSVCLTHQIVSHVVFSPTGKEVMAAAMSAGHLFIYTILTDFKLNLVRYTEVGRGLADCFLMQVGDAMRAFVIMLFSDKYAIGERIICINAVTGKDNKFMGKMQGPYGRLLPLSTKDTMLGIPHLTKQYHVLKLSGEKGANVTVKMGPIIDTGHNIPQYDGYYNPNVLLTFGYDGTVVKRPSHAPSDYDFKLTVSHRYECGVKQALMDIDNRCLVHLSGNRTVGVASLTKRETTIQLETPRKMFFNKEDNKIFIISDMEKNYLDLQEEKKVHEEEMDYKTQREQIVKSFQEMQSKLVSLLEENIAEKPLHQLSLSEFNLHIEHKKERMKQAEQEREKIRQDTEARIVAQDKVTKWIKQQCWDTMATPRVKLLAIFSHYQVENYAVLPTQRDKWPELQQVEALRTIEMENDDDLFRPWEEPPEQRSIEGTLPPISTEAIVQLAAESKVSVQKDTATSKSQIMTMDSLLDSDDSLQGDPYVLSGSMAHKFVPIPAYMIPQTLAFSFLQMNWLRHIIRLNVQNMRIWFNKQFDDLMNQKKREVGLVEERNARLRFIIEELNKLSDLRGSFHHLRIVIKDPQWAQEEHPHRLIKVDPEECSIEPYISPSQIVIIPPDPGPKDDFRERALIDMMDGVLEKLWHEEIKKPIPMPQCMLDKDPEHFNEEDLRQVFDYEAKVAFRKEEREKYRKMLHAEYAKLSQVLNEGIVKFNQKVKEMWLLKLKVDSVIGQETLNLMRLRRTNLDRIEMAEKMEDIRNQIKKDESEVDTLQADIKIIQEQSDECQRMYDNLSQKDKYMDRTFKNHFADLSPIVVDSCYKYFKKRPKWHQRPTMTPVVLYELAHAVGTGVRPPMLHADTVDYFRGVEQLDQISNMPQVMDEGLWATMCKLRRAKIENEIRMRAVVQETAYVDSAHNVWFKAVQARKNKLTILGEQTHKHREEVELLARNKTIQLVLPAGQVEILTTGHMEDFEDAALILREDVDKINDLIMKVGQMKLRMMKKQIEFRKGILAKEWEHAQMKMKLRHMEQELYSYRRLKIPKELQLFLKNKELGYTDEMDFIRMEKEFEATKTSINRILNDQIRRVEDIELKVSAVEGKAAQLENLIARLNVKVSEKRLHQDQLEPIRKRRILKERMDTLVKRSSLIREVQANHTTIVLLQTELELLRLKTYPTLASFRTID